MRAAVIYKSFHHGNTQRVAEVIADALGGELYSVEQAADLDASQFDLVGFGSGIYFCQHHRELRQFVAKWPDLPRWSFVFSTAGIATLAPLWHGTLVRLLRQGGSEVIGEFTCPGFDTFGPLWLVGGLHRGRPNERDLERANQFARELLADPRIADSPARACDSKSANQASNRQG
ncbi:MAG: flavodoxin family protein [Pirellulaceae bacterium]|jgi:flavodoxin|nr:flavodoxin family protein [Pirellulaceae bacterium]